MIDSRVKMKQFATLLRIPRAHHKYINHYGAYDFIQKCEEIIRDNDTRRLRQERLDERAAKRQAISIDRVIRNQRG